MLESRVPARRRRGGGAGLGLGGASTRRWR